MIAAIFLVLLGPGVREQRRLMDLIRSLRHCEADMLACSTLVLVDDGDQDVRDILDLNSLGFCRICVVRNPYRGGEGGAIVYDRLMGGIIVGLRKIVELEDAEFVLKLDTDALAAGKFGDRIREFLRANPDAGMVGSYRHNPDGTPRGTEDWWARHLRRTCGLCPTRLVALNVRYRLRWQLRHALRRWWIRRTWLRVACRNGWNWGDHILGGAYALSPKVIHCLRSERKWLSDPKLFEGTRVPEDIGLSILVPALGLKLAEYNRPGEVFGIWYQRPTRPIADLVKDGYALIHSIKSVDCEEENQLRKEAARVIGIDGLG